MFFRNKKLRDARSVEAMLEQNEAYRRYQSKLDSLSDSFTFYKKYIIDDIENAMKSSESFKIKYKRDHCYVLKVNERFTSQLSTCNGYLITKSELTEIKEHFTSRGYNFSYFIKPNPISIIKGKPLTIIFKMDCYFGK